MSKSLCLFILLGICCWKGLSEIEIPDHKPLHFAMQKEYDAIAKGEEVLTFQGKDTAITHSVSLLSDEEGFPLLYYSDILTPVCIDNICKPMAIEIYWNLLGAYVGYGIHQDNLLTKYDHDLFEPQDYEKLHQLLLNRHSILERRKLSDLFDADAEPQEKVKFKGKEVDAVSGATKAEIKESVVDGALYSCYTIWHLVHGQVRQEMVRHLETIYDEDLAEYFLNSNYSDYQLYALKNFEAAAFERHLPRIIEIFSAGKPLTRSYILKKLPQTAWQVDSTTVKLYRDFAEMDINSKTLLINNLEHARPVAAELLAVVVDEMTKNQLRTYLHFLTTKPELKTEEITAQLQRVVANQVYAYTYLIEAFLNGE